MMSVPQLYYFQVCGCTCTLCDRVNHKPDSYFQPSWKISLHSNSTTRHNLVYEFYKIVYIYSIIWCTLRYPV